MLRKSFLIALTLTAFCYCNATAGELIQTVKDNNKQVVEKTRIKFEQTDVNIKKLRSTKTNTNRISFKEYDCNNVQCNPNINFDSTPHEYSSSLCGVTQINGHQILIETSATEVNALLTITDEKGNIVFNQSISLTGHVYFDLDFLDSGNYKGTIHGVGFYKSFTLSI